MLVALAAVWLVFSLLPDSSCTYLLRGAACSSVTFCWRVGVSSMGTAVTRDTLTWRARPDTVVGMRECCTGTADAGMMSDVLLEMMSPPGMRSACSGFRNRRSRRVDIETGLYSPARSSSTATGTIVSLSAQDATSSNAQGFLGGSKDAVHSTDATVAEQQRPGGFRGFQACCGLLQAGLGALYMHVRPGPWQAPSTECCSVLCVTHLGCK